MTSVIYSLRLIIIRPGLGETRLLGSIFTQLLSTHNSNWNVHPDRPSKALILTPF